MAGELPVDLRTQRKGDGQDGWVAASDGEASAAALGRRSPPAEAPSGGSGSPPARGQPEGSGAQPTSGTILSALRSAVGRPAGSREEKKAQTCLPHRKRRYPVEGAGEEARGPLAGQAPKRESREGQTGAWGAHANGYCSPYTSVGYPRLPSLYYPGKGSTSACPGPSPRKATPSPKLSCPLDPVGKNEWDSGTPPLPSQHPPGLSLSFRQHCFPFGPGPPSPGCMSLQHPSSPARPCLRILWGVKCQEKGVRKGETWNEEADSGPQII